MKFFMLINLKLLLIAKCFLLNIVGNEIFSANKYENANSSWKFFQFFMLINLKLLLIANCFLLNIAENEIFSADKYENANSSWHFHIY